jgi:hypothetical protein
VVTVIATYAPVEGDPDCARVVRVTLSAALGDRTVVDGHTGEAVSVYPAPLLVG